MADPTVQRLPCISMLTTSCGSVYVLFAAIGQAFCVIFPGVSSGVLLEFSWSYYPVMETPVPDTQPSTCYTQYVPKQQTHCRKGTTAISFGHDTIMLASNRGPQYVKFVTSKTAWKHEPKNYRYYTTSNFVTVVHVLPELLYFYNNIYLPELFYLYYNI